MKTSFCARKKIMFNVTFDSQKMCSKEQSNCTGTLSELMRSIFDWMSIFSFWIVCGDSKTPCPSNNSAEKLQRFRSGRVGRHDKSFSKSTGYWFDIILKKRKYGIDSVRSGTILLKIQWVSPWLSWGQNLAFCIPIHVELTLVWEAQDINVQGFRVVHCLIRKRAALRYSVVW